MNIDTSSLKINFTGEVITPSSSTYNQARNVYSGSGSPLLVLRPKITEDIIQAVNFARDNSLLLSVRGGGHSSAGFGTNDDGIVIDMSLMNSIEIINESKNIVRIGGGAKW